MLYLCVNFSIVLQACVELDGLPKKFVFIRNGIPVGQKQEKKILALSCLPKIILRDVAAIAIASAAPSPSRPVTRGPSSSPSPSKSPPRGFAPSNLQQHLPTPIEPLEISSPLVKSSFTPPPSKAPSLPRIERQPIAIPIQSQPIGRTPKISSQAAAPPLSIPSIPVSQPAPIVDETEGSSAVVMFQDKKVGHLNVDLTGNDGAMIADLRKVRRESPLTESYAV